MALSSLTSVVKQCNDLLAEFNHSLGEHPPIGTRWHTMTTEDFCKLVTCVKRMAEISISYGEEID